MVTIDWLEQAEPLAESVNGEETVLFIAGLATETAANAGAPNTVRKSVAAESLSRSFIEGLQIE